MTKVEKAKLIKLYRHALWVNKHATSKYPEPSYQFNKGYEWGICKALKAVGISSAERDEIWSEVYWPRTEREE